MKARASDRKKRVGMAGKAYLTKRATLRRSRTAVRLAAARALNIVGYVIKAKDGWIVRESQDGTITRISRYRAAHQLPVKLD